MRKMREEFREVIQVLSKVLKRDDEARRRDEETKKMVENMREGIIKLIKEQLGNQKEIAELKIEKLMIMMNDISIKIKLKQQSPSHAHAYIILLCLCSHNILVNLGNIISPGNKETIW